jgi:membrane associated rhomboid family serine protease
VSVPERDGSDSPPIFNDMPPGVLILATVIVGSFLIGLVHDPARIWWISANAVVAIEPGDVLPAQPFGHVLPYLTHVFVHFGALHIVFNTAALVALGRAVGKAFGYGLQGTLGFLIFFFTCSVAGALMDVMLHSGDLRILGGASTGVSGLFAAAGWVRGGWRGMAAMAMPWIGLNLLLGLTGTILPIPIGWAAHIGGTIAGAILFLPMVLLLKDSRR